jgi:transposase
MGKVKLLQEIRQMQFEKLYDNWRAKRLTEEEAAELLGMHPRTFRRWSRKYEEEGIDGLVDQRIEGLSNRAAPVDEVMEMIQLFKTKYYDFNVKHFHERWVNKHAGSRSYTWVKNKLQERRLVEREKSRGPYRKHRDRKPMIGMMIHQDGSTHEWIQDEMWDLIITMDDADSQIYSGFFVEEEGTWSTFQGIKEVIKEKGLFCSFYTDRGSHYWTTSKAGEKVDEDKPTQVNRALKYLGIEMIPAYSPEARGRSERTFGTIQGRLPQELRLEQIKTMSEANRYLREVFIPDFNRRFTVEAAVEGSAFVPWFNTLNIDDILCIQEQRTVNKDNTIDYNNKRLQLPNHGQGNHLAKTKVRVHEYEDGQLAVFHGPLCLGKFSKEGELLVLVKEQRLSHQMLADNVLC